MLYIGICDDEISWINPIRNVCKIYEQENNEKFEYMIFRSGEEVLAYEGEISVLFLDIEMQGLDGIETMNQLIKKNNVWKIVFITSHEERMIDTFGLKTLGFVSKTKDIDSIKKWLGIAINEIKRCDMIEITEGSKKIKVRTEDVLYIQGERNYVKIVTSGKEYVMIGNLKSWEGKIKNTNIYRCHKSYLVNFEHIRTINDDIKLDIDNTMIPLGRRYREIIRADYSDYCFKVLRERTK